jgi:nicotinamide-nucleotide amidase
MTGGLGPTDDDLTVDVLATLAGTQALDDPDHLRKLETLARRYPARIRLETTRRQVRVVEGSQVLRNERGLAPGMLVQIATTGGATKPVAAMPGVPQEMELMFLQDLLPALETLYPESGRARRVFYIYNMGESTFQARFFGISGRGAKDVKPLVDVASLPPDFRWGVTAAAGHLKVFLECDDAAIIARLEDLARTEMAAQYLPEIVDLLIHESCSRSGLRLGAAESCTGGLIGKILTDRPGSSTYFLGSLVTYANEAKVELLGVPQEILAKHGAVSEECARAMAMGAQLRLGADFAVAVTGIAGPEGGSAAKPVGTVFVGCARRGGTENDARVYALNIPLDRDRVRQYSAQMALFYLYHYMLQ